MSSQIGKDLKKNDDLVVNKELTELKTLIYKELSGHRPVGCELTRLRRNFLVAPDPRVGGDEGLFGLSTNTNSYTIKVMALVKQSVHPIKYH